MPAGLDPVNAHESHQQFIRGVVWADDPEGLLFDNTSGTTDYSTGFQWASHFGAGQLGDHTTLTARSHFGNLQFVHGMASTDAEEAETTKLNMLDWARFLVDVAARRIAPSDWLGDIAELSESFPDDGDRTVSELFGWAEPQRSRPASARSASSST